MGAVLVLRIHTDARKSEMFSVFVSTCLLSFCLWWSCGLDLRSFQAFAAKCEGKKYTGMI